MSTGTSGTFATACRICAVGCGTLVEVDDGRIVKVTGDDADPVSQGYTCSKGRSGPEFHHHSNRLDVPMMRVAGDLVDSSWDEALDDIAARLRGIIDEHGSGVVASYLGTGGPLDPAGFAMAEGFFRSVGTEQKYSALSIDCPSKFYVPQLVAGVQLHFQPDIERTDLFLALGVNTVVSHGHGLMMPNPLGRLRDLRARGGSFVVADPRTTESARNADLHLPVRPGADPALLGFAVREVLRRGPDEDFLARCVDAASLERLRAAVEPYDLTHAAAATGVGADALAQFADMVLAAGRIGIETGTGVSMSASSNLTEWLAWALGAVTGSLDRPGGCSFNPGFLRPMENALPAGRGDLAPSPASRPDLPRVVNGEMPCAALADEIFAGNVRALIVRVGNPAMTFPDTERIRRAFAQLDLLVVIDARNNETAAIATHVLPMADHFERSDLLTGYLQADPFMRWAPAVVTPTAERRPQWWMFAELGRKMGYPLFGSERRDALFADVELTDEVVAEAISFGARHPWAEISDAPYGIKDRTLEPGWMIPERLPGPLDIAPATFVDLLAALPSHDAGRSGGRAGLVLVNRRTSGQYNSVSTEVTGPRVRPSRPTLLCHPDDADERGLRAGELATIATVHGSVEAEIEVTESIRRGVVSLPHAWASADVNQLTSADEFDALNGMPRLSGFEVTVSAAAPA